MQIPTNTTQTPPPPHTRSHTHTRSTPPSPPPTQGRARPSLAKLYNWRYKSLGDLPLVQQQQEFLLANAGFSHEVQFVNVPDYNGRGEFEPLPHFTQNLGEAEYLVTVYQV